MLGRECDGGREGWGEKKAGAEGRGRRDVDKEIAGGEEGGEIGLVKNRLKYKRVT